MSQVANPVKERCTAPADGGASDAVHSPIAMSCTPEAMQGTPTAMSRIGCGALSGHRMLWRTSGAVHSARWHPLPACGAHRGARAAHRRCGGARPGAVRCAHRRRGRGDGARTDRTVVRFAARGALPGGARGLRHRGRIKRSRYITDPLDFRPAEVPNARYGIAGRVASHTESARGRFWCADFGVAAEWCAPARAGGALGARTEDVVRAPSPRCAHHGAVAGECSAPRCAPVRGREWTTSSVRAPVRTMPCTGGIQWVHRMPGCSTPPPASALRSGAHCHPVDIAVESTPTRCASRWAPLSGRCIVGPP